MTDLVDERADGPLFFKTLYAPIVHESGVLGFWQPPRKPTVGGRCFDALALLAITRNPQRIRDLPLAGELRGKIFAVCTLVDAGTMQRSDLENPVTLARHPDMAKRWPYALAIDQLWRLTPPKAYGDFGINGIAGSPLLEITDPTTQRKLRKWLRDVPRSEWPVTHSPAVRAALGRKR